MMNLTKLICLMVVIAVIIVSCQSLAIQEPNLNKLMNTLLNKDRKICCDCPDGICYVKCC